MQNTLQHPKATRDSLSSKKKKKKKEYIVMPNRLRTMPQSMSLSVSFNSHYTVSSQAKFSTGTCSLYCWKRIRASNDFSHRYVMWRSDNRKTAVVGSTVQVLPTAIVYQHVSSEDINGDEVRVQLRWVPLFLIPFLSLYCSAKVYNTSSIIHYRSLSIV